MKRTTSALAVLAAGTLLLTAGCGSKSSAGAASGSGSDAEPGVACRG